MKAKYPKEFMERIREIYKYGPSSEKAGVIADFISAHSISISETKVFTNYNEHLPQYFDGRPVAFIGIDKRCKPKFQEFITIKKEGDQ